MFPSQHRNGPEVPTSDSLTMTISSEEFHADVPVASRFADRFAERFAERFDIDTLTFS
jgi:hypothetical protein